MPYVYGLEISDIELRVLIFIRDSFHADSDSKDIDSLFARPRHCDPTVCE